MLPVAGLASKLEISTCPTVLSTFSSTFSLSCSSEAAKYGFTTNQTVKVVKCSRSDEPRDQNFWPRLHDKWCRPHGLLALSRHNST